MQHTCARRPLAFALASLTTLSSVLALSGAPSARACSPPPTFSEMLGMSEVIVTGSIAEMSKQSVTYGDESFEVPVAIVHVSEVLKGSVQRGQTIRISRIGGEDFSRVINDEEETVTDTPSESEVPLSMRTGLFLASGPDQDGPEPGRIVTWAGMRLYDITEDARRDALVPLVREYTTLEKIEDPVRRHTALLEWIVRCSENPETRREGFYDFSSVNDMRQWRMNSEDASDRDHPAAKISFTDGQIDRLVTVWLESLAKREDGAMWFGNALGEYRGELVATKLLDCIAADGESGSQEIGTWMQTVASIYEWRSGHLLTQQLWESEDPVVRAKIVERFLELAPIRGEIPEAIVGEGSDDEATEAVEDVESEAVTEMEEVEREAVEAVEQVGVEGEEEAVEPLEFMDNTESGRVLRIVSRPEGLNKR